MTFEETQLFIDQNFPLFQKVAAKAYNGNLDKILALSAAIKNPHKEFPSVHIAGTNGKGSCTHLLAAMLQAAGYKVGVFCSPYLVDFRECTKINGQYIAKDAVVQFVCKNKKILLEIAPSFFEFSAALSFWYFAQNKVDIAIIETGMGGRLDATNIIDPILSIITNIGLDHQAFLGNTLDKIAHEKAGIIKHGTPVIIGETQEDCYYVFEKHCLLLKAPILFADEVYKAQELHTSSSNKNAYKIEHAGIVLYDQLELGLKATYQQKNLITVLAAIDVLNIMGYNCTKEAVQLGASQVKSLTNFWGRWEIVQSEKPRIIFDTAHNVEGLRLVKESLNKETYKKLHLVIGMTADKNACKMLNQLPFDAKYYLCEANSPRSMKLKDLELAAKELAKEAISYVSVKEAFQAAKKNASQEDLIFVSGSNYVLAELVN